MGKRRKGYASIPASHLEKFKEIKTGRPNLIPFY
jgi:hypothetical protein